MILKYLRVSTVAVAALGVTACGYKHSKYENPITKDTQL